MTYEKMSILENTPEVPHSLPKTNLNKVTPADSINNIASKPKIVTFFNILINSDFIGNSFLRFSLNLCSKTWDSAAETKEKGTKIASRVWFTKPVSLPEKKLLM